MLMSNMTNQIAPRTSWVIAAPRIGCAGIRSQPHTSPDLPNRPLLSFCLYRRCREPPLAAGSLQVWLCFELQCRAGWFYEMASVSSNPETTGALADWMVELRRFEPRASF